MRAECVRELDRTEVRRQNLSNVSDVNVRDLQDVLLEMLLEIERVCSKNDIQYSLIMGTLLGAVRHSGFIPWDDDLDIAMTRDDFEKFKRACASDLDRNRFFFQDDTTDEHYRWGYARIRRNETEFVRVGQEHLKMRTGIFLDIFPLDGVPDALPSRYLHSAYCFILRKVLYSEVGKKSANWSVHRQWYSLLSKVPHAWVMRRVRELSLKNRHSRHVRILTFPLPTGAPAGYLRRWFAELTRVQFEGSMFPAIRDAEEFLTCSYGDFMQLPAPEAQKPSHPASKFHLPKGIYPREHGHVCPESIVQYPDE